MLNVDRVWTRVSRLPQFQGKQLANYIIQVITQNFTLTSAGVSAATPVNMPAGGVVLGVTGDAEYSGQAATVVTRPGLNMFDISIAYQATDRSVAGTSRGLASALFGPYGDLFPAKELVIPIQGALVYTIGNRTTSTINVTINSHILVPNQIG